MVLLKSPFMNAPQKPGILHPCPMLLARMSQQDGSHFCGSCKKNVVDFRGKTIEEIQVNSTPDTCGIFYTDQVHVAKPKRWYVKLAFHFLVCLSFLGVSVKPLFGQHETTEILKTNENLPVCHAPKEGAEQEEVARQKEFRQGKAPLSRKKRRGKYRFVTIGCPSF
jgi:hypothetical protein